MSRPVLYVCAPYSTRTPDEAVDTLHAVRGAIERGYCPVFAPFMFERLLSDENPAQRATGIACGLTLLDHADAIVVVGERLTKGMRTELGRWRGPTFFWPELPAARELAKEVTPAPLA